MATRNEKDLSESQRALWLKAVAAIELRNFGYAISLLQEILKQEPEFLNGRQLLRRTEVTQSKATKKGRFAISSAPLSLLKAQRELKKDPKRVVELSEKVLETDPYHRQANWLLKDAAVAAGWPEIGVFALQILLEENGRDLKVLRELARLYHELGQSEREVEIYNRIGEIDPLDAEALRLGKDASARASMKSGGWTQAESYRDLIKDKKLAVSLEQQSRLALSGESLDQQISETYARHQAEPQNVDHARRLGALCEQKEDIEHAIAWFQYAADLTSGSDAGLVRKAAELKMQQFEIEVAARELFLRSHGPEHPEHATQTQALAEAKKQRAQMLVDETRQQVERNPTDLQLRFDLGRHLLEAGEFREALPQLQRARQNPNARLKAMNLLGQCYAALSMFDLAARQLEEAAQEILTMDAMKKEIVYHLGLVYEQMGDAEKSIACMKQIYAADYGFRDVAARVERSYGSSQRKGARP